MTGTGGQPPFFISGRKKIGVFSLTDKEKEMIVKLVASGKNSYKDLRAVAPNESNWNVIGHPGRVSPGDVIRINRSMDYVEALKYVPVETDSFCLTEAGINLLYKLEKDSRKIKLAEESNYLSEQAIKESRQSKWIALSALIVAIIALIKSLLT